MMQIKKIIEKPWALIFLLPGFFVLHSYLQYAGLISVRTALKVLGVMTFFFVLFFLILLAVTKTIQRSAHITLWFGFIVLFYGAIKNFFKSMPGLYFMSRYSVLVPVLIIASIFITIRIIRKQDFARLNRFLNILLVLFLIVDIVIMVYSGASVNMQSNKLVKNDIVKTASMTVLPEYPDIYFLVFDSYPGTTFLEHYLKYDNSPLNVILKKKGFYVAGNPRSNYNRTALSIASTLNFEYLQGLSSRSVIEPRYYNQASFSIEHAAAPAIFIHSGYKIFNLSFFDLEQHPSILRENFLVLPEEDMLLYNTLIENFRRDLLWHFSPALNVNKKVLLREPQGGVKYAVNTDLGKRDFNNAIIDSLQKIPSHYSNKPKFVYAHFYLPHPPFFYDRNGRELDVNMETVEQTMEDSSSFLSYLEYTNKVMLKTVEAILNRPGKPPVIVIQSDHGYRDFKKSFVGEEQYFKNYSAFYFPDANYTMLYDTISNVNTFPVIFNKYFNTHIPMLKDTSIFLAY